MTVDSIFGQARPLLKLIGSALVIVSALKMFGVAIGVPGSVADEALVGIGLLHV